ncbi:hypothetical protein [Polyangium mundeleinium]|uniref:Haem-binding uptake Tiki superfamily ChaN domain-containing protein n=1 Tax=Polyangium mundeleinium TaxID=2995306 RepID=A0ABT5F7L7_9BACT|nr:hypothetical protein [Polyangium mundeleinium]MDC0749403.1 hypothetical protein [Polyangium mundeleinium]
MLSARLLPLLCLVSLAACRTPDSASPPPPATATAAATSSAAPAPIASAAPAPSASTAPAAAAPPEPCGEMGCLLYDTPEAAFAAILAENPLILGIGESHAQKGKEGIPTATKRFTDTFLPLLAGKASDIVLEIWVSEGKCGKEKEAQVAEQQKPVTQGQAKTNQNEFVTLGDAAYALGVKPHILRASCADYDAIVKAGPDSVIVMLEMIARLMDEKAKALASRNANAGAGKMVLTYGGAIHNDLTARPGREKWTFGPDLAAATADRYVELDLVVPEFIQDNDAWKALPWVPHFKRDAHPTKTTVFRPAKGSFVLIFPKTAQ